MTTPSNTQKLLFIRRHCEKRLEMAGKATKGPWTEEDNDVWSEDSISPVVYDVEIRENAYFIASARTDCPMAMEMVVEMMTGLSQLNQ